MFLKFLDATHEFLAFSHHFPEFFHHFCGSFHHFAALLFTTPSEALLRDDANQGRGLALLFLPFWRIHRDFTLDLGATIMATWDTSWVHKYYIYMCIYIYMCVYIEYIYNIGILCMSPTIFWRRFNGEIGIHGIDGRVGKNVSSQPYSDGTVKIQLISSEMVSWAIHALKLRHVGVENHSMGFWYQP